MKGYRNGLQDILNGVIILGVSLSPNVFLMCTFYDFNTSAISHHHVSKEVGHINDKSVDSSGDIFSVTELVQYYLLVG